MVTVKGYRRAAHSVKAHDVKGHTRKTAKKHTEKKGTSPTLVCDGKIKAAWRDRYNDFKAGNTLSPRRIKCLGTGDTYLDGSGPSSCSLRANCKDDHCIWFKPRAGYGYPGYP